MVRVISVHHFVGQDVEGCGEEVVGAAVDEAVDRILLALPTHAVQVRSLAPSSSPPFLFPTVDRVVRMLHCAKGNYVATLETKRNRQGRETTYARAYVNWDAASTNPVSTTDSSETLKGKDGEISGPPKENVASLTQQQQPMRARIAGRVTPSGSQWWPGPSALEMLELPLRRAASPDSPMAVCNSTGNLLIGLGHTLTLFAFCNPIHRLSKLRYIDFEESFTFEMSFRPSHLLMAEDLIACMSKDALHIFRVGMDEEEEEQEEGGKKDEEQNELIGGGSKMEVVYLPSIVEHDRSLRMTVNAAGHPGPFREASQMVVVVGQKPLPNLLSPSASPSAAESKKVPAKLPGIRHLLRLQILACAKLGREEFRCLSLRPLYSPTSVNDDELEAHGGGDDEGSKLENLNLMRSPYYNNLASIMFFVATQQEGYLYHFTGSKPLKIGHSPAKAMLPDAVYPLTAPVSSVVMEQYAVHALTETGLETYTMRAGKNLLQRLEQHAGLKISPKQTAYPSSEDPVCLIGLRPFFGVEHLLLTHRHLVLLASCSSPSEGSPSTSSQDSPVSMSPSGANTGRWTQYSLQLPTPPELFHDMMQVGSAHVSSNPATYLHLLSEGHLVLRLALRSQPYPPLVLSDMSKKIKEASRNDLKSLFEESCALLADQYIRDDADPDGTLASAYYRMAGLSPSQVIDRIMDRNGSKEGNIAISGLIRYIKKELLSNEEVDNGNDPLAAPDGEAFSLKILTILEENSPEDVSMLVLHSSALLACRQGVERVLKVLKQRQQSFQSFLGTNRGEDPLGSSPPPQDALALAIVCLHRGCPDRACAVLTSLGAAGHLTSVLEEHSSLLFELDEKEGLSELAAVVAEACPEALAEVLGKKSCKGGPKVLAGAVRALREKVAAAGSAAEGASTGKALRLLLEKHFAPVLSGKVEDSNGTSEKLLEELKMLVRSYLAGLVAEIQINVQKGETANATNDSEWEIFGPRLPFLERMSPFSNESRKKTSGSASNPPTDGQRMCLIKLQSMLCSTRLNPECIAEVRQFLQGRSSTLGRHSLLTLCLPPREATLFLLEVCPQALLQYAKDKYSADNDWKYLLLLLQRRLLTSQEQSPMRVFYTRILRDALSHLAHTLNLEEFVKVLPPGGGKGEVATYVAHYLRSCQQIQHANHIRSLIIATGNQLLSTLHL